MQLSPLDPIRYFYDSLAATAALAAEDFEEARRLAKRSLRANRSHTSTLRALIIAAVELGDINEARLTMTRLRQLEPELTVSGFLLRSPSSDFDTGIRWSNALRAAGLPH